MASEARKLPNRRRPKSKGRLIRVSHHVYDALNIGRDELSWDDWLRWLFGLPDKKGVRQPMVEGLLEATSGQFFLRMPDTSWEDLNGLVKKVAAQIALNKNMPRPEKPIRMREIR